MPLSYSNFHSNKTAIRQVLSGNRVQPKLTIGSPDDVSEREADWFADQVMRMPPSENVPTVLNHAPVIQRKCQECEEELQRQPNEEEEESTQAGPASTGPSFVSTDVAANIQNLRGAGRRLDASSRDFFESRFGRDFSKVRLHTDPEAATVADSIRARAFTLGNDIVFGTGQYHPTTNKGKRLMAHELTHVVQQRGDNHSGTLRRLPEIGPYGPGERPEPADPPEWTVPAGRASLEVRPAVNTPPCACLVFLHNDERNARQAAETLHRECRYNLAIVRDGTSRSVWIRGAGLRDPNELFPESIQQECTRDETACRTYITGHNDLRAAQMQYFLAVRECSNNFSIPTVALHNNTISDTAAYRRAIPGIGHHIASLYEDIDRETETGRGSRADLRARLGNLNGANFSSLMSRGGTTNIFRWCNLPEIRKCHIGNPLQPDHVIWTTNERDFDTLSQQNVNVVWQSGSSDAAGSESQTDLSTLYERLGQDVRFLNIETPHTRRRVPDNEEVRRSNMAFILEVLGYAGLNCCGQEEEASNTPPVHRWTPRGPEYGP
ncbi:MAG: DUF4157 domain-containing protein [Acidobacteriota bacterium]|nr:DUF4157 domain-containing protein [Acidobacteriota bacterium]